jgi:hypothetical protein
LGDGAGPPPPNPQSPIPNPQSPIPNPHLKRKINIFLVLKNKLIINKIQLFILFIIL